MDNLQRPFSSLCAAAALAAALAGSAPASAEPLTLWLTRPLYPGQQGLVARTDASLSALFPEQARAQELVGREALARRLKDTPVALDCILGEVACEDPIDALVSGLGVTRVVLLKVGQDESGYRFRVTSWAPGGEPPQVGEGSGQVLERALLSALVKVVPLTATVEVVSAPPGAAVFVDGERVGTAPATLQVLPGDHVVKLELPSHLPVEVKQNLPARGAATISRALEKVPARLVVKAAPPGTAISVDGVAAGTDKLDRGIQPGSHVVALALDGFVPYQERLEIEPGGTATVERTLAPTTFTRVQTAMGEAQDAEAARGTYLQVAYESAWFTSAQVESDTKGLGGILNKGKKQLIQLGAAPTLDGMSAEWGRRWRFGGFTWLGASVLGSGAVAYAASAEEAVPVTNGPCPAGSFPQDDGLCSARMFNVRAFALRALQPQLQLLLWRFALNAQGGLGLRATTYLPQGGGLEKVLWQVDPLLEFQGRLRFNVVGGLYLAGSFRHSRPLLERPVAAINSIEGGLGYAF